MPRNRSELDRADKVDAIVVAALDRLQCEGYAGLSVAALARELGLAQNAIYWYFPSKDHLLVAAVERALHDLLERKPRTGDAVARITWFTDQLAELQDLRQAIRDRARHAEVAAAFDRDTTALLQALLLGLLSESVPSERRVLAADSVMALCEGVLVAGLSRPARRRLLAHAVPLLLV